MSLYAIILRHSPRIEISSTEQALYVKFQSIEDSHLKFFDWANRNRRSKSTVLTSFGTLPKIETPEETLLFTAGNSDFDSLVIPITSFVTSAEFDAFLISETSEEVFAGDPRWSSIKPTQFEIGV